MKIRWQNSTVLNIPASVQEGWRVGRMSLSPGKRFSLVTDEMIVVVPNIEEKC
jgi:hypothetical protein